MLLLVDLADGLADGRFLDCEGRRPPSSHHRVIWRLEGWRQQRRRHSRVGFVDGVDASPCLHSPSSSSPFLWVVSSSLGMKLDVDISSTAAPQPAAKPIDISFIHFPSTHPRSYFDKAIPQLTFSTNPSSLVCRTASFEAPDTFTYRPSRPRHSSSLSYLLSITTTMPFAAFMNLSDDDSLVVLRVDCTSVISNHGQRKWEAFFFFSHVGRNSQAGRARRLLALMRSRA